MIEKLDLRAPVPEEMEWNEILSERIQNLGAFVDCADRNASLALDRLASIEARLASIEAFLEMRPAADPVWGDSLDNRITHALNATVSALGEGNSGPIND